MHPTPKGGRPRIGTTGRMVVARITDEAHHQIETLRGTATRAEWVRAAITEKLDRDTLAAHA